MTLPLIYVVQNGSPAEVALVKNAVTKCDASCINDIIDVVLKSGSVDYTLSIALKEEKLASEALACLPDSEYRKALKNLALFSVNRNK